MKVLTGILLIMANLPAYFIEGFGGVTFATASAEAAEPIRGQPIPPPIPDPRPPTSPIPSLPARPPTVSCLCPSDRRLVCGSDGHTYVNECAVGCESRRRRKLGLRNITIVGTGSCRSPNCPCSLYPTTICGTNNISYRNTCYLNCTNRILSQRGLPLIGIQNVGPCLNKNCPCTKEYRPVCASDYKTYDNPCLVHCENRRHFALDDDPLTILYYGPCYDCGCPKSSNPVCGKDGTTYRNLCLLKCISASKVSDGLPAVTKCSDGICGCNCKDYNDPVCGTDDKNYKNICLLHCESNRRVYSGQGEIVLAYGGPCYCNCSYCTIKYSPVCGSDGRSYWNNCWRNCYSNCNRRRKQTPVSKLYSGYCANQRPSSQNGCI